MPKAAPHPSAPRSTAPAALLPRARSCPSSPRLPLALPQLVGELRTFLEQQVGVLDPGTTVALLAGYGRGEEVMHYARCRGDNEGLLDCLLQRGEVRGDGVERGGVGWAGQRGWGGAGQADIRRAQGSRRVQDSRREAGALGREQPARCGSPMGMQPCAGSQAS